jgi:AraC-like DNA-binding protein
MRGSTDAATARIGCQSRLTARVPGRFTGLRDVSPALPLLDLAGSSDSDGRRKWLAKILPLGHRVGAGPGALGPHRFLIVRTHRAEARRAMPDHTNGASVLRALGDRRLQRVLEFVDDNLQNPICLADLAAIANLSPYYFSRTFRETTGLSPYRFVRERRLEKAKQLVVEGKDRLTEIAAICNFSSQASFTRAFTRLVGLSPAKYRQLHGTTHPAKGEHHV